ncbi:MAG TPA: DASS family sodium-coupled anion symporter [Flavobacterium sp.]|uniref:SLC13 family permease n=1 Tax=Flavobacterium sp. TaxID=239 RepID=UPI002BC22715|nr:DASS family sodium-coupled anion symporter [Flavobacterium sp.]HSD14663.1 DASS family sodium-coupled anion symporter [Flavobacterium sp.]
MEEKGANGNKHKSVYHFLLSFAVALGVTLILKEPNFTDSQVYVIFLLFFAIGLWITEAIPAFAVSLLIISYLVFALGNKHFNSAPENIEHYVQTFSDSIIWLLLGGFFLAKAMANTKLDETLFRFTLKLAGTNPRNLLIGIMTTTMLASMLLSNSATTTMVLAAIMPLLKTLDKNSGVSKALLLGIPVAATAGGMATIVGTPANAIAVGALHNAGITIEFIDWMIYGIPLAIVVNAVCCFALIKAHIKDPTPISTAFLDDMKTDVSKEAALQRNIVIGVTFLTIGLWVTSSLHGIKPSSVCAVPIVILTLTGVLNGKDVRTLGWDTLLLVAGGLSLGLALDHTGLLKHYAEILITLQLDSMLLLSIFGVLATALATVMTNSTATALMVPICMAILPDQKLEVALIIALSSSSALRLLASSPSNAIVFNTGYLEQKDFRLTGIIFGLLGPILAILWVLLMS